LEDFIEIGILQKSYGISGHAKARFDLDLSELPPYIFLQIDGSLVPFGVEEVDIPKSLVKLEWLNNPETMDKLVPSSVFLARNDMIHALQKSENVLLSALKKYTLTDKDDNKVGVIKQIEEYPSQLMLVIERKEEEHLLPFHEDLILEMDHFSKVVKYDLPAGILDINQ